MCQGVCMWCRAAEAGLGAAVSALLEAGADGRAHPVTSYSPLYIACYHGRTDIVKLLLVHFPHAVQVSARIKHLFRS